MNKFVSAPLDKLMNRENFVSRLERVEARTAARPSAKVGNLAELSPNAGDQIAGTYFCTDPATGVIRGYLTAIPRAEAPGYYLAFFNGAGVFQFGIDANNGYAVAGGGNVQLTSSGIAILEGDAGQAFLSFKDETGATEKFAVKVAGDGMQIQSLLAGGELRLSSIMTDAASPDVIWYEDPDAANRAKLEINPGSDGLRVQLGYDHYIDALDVDGNGSAVVRFNERNHNIDFQVQGDTDDNVLYIDASTDRVGIGTATPGYKLDVAGDVNVSGAFKVNGTDISAGLTFLPFGTYIDTGPFSATNKYPYLATVDRNLTLAKWANSFFVESPNDGSNYWSMKLYEWAGGGLLATLTTAAASASTPTVASTTSFSDNTMTASNVGLYVKLEKTGNPGNLYLAGPALQVS